MAPSLRHPLVLLAIIVSSSSSSSLSTAAAAFSVASSSFRRRRPVARRLAPQQLGEFEPLPSDGRRRRVRLADHWLDGAPVPLREAWDAQRALVARRLDENDDDEEEEDVLLCLEHEPVYTLGTGADPSFVLTEEKRESSAEVVRIDRGGEVTYHGPGQLVVYPVLDLRRNYRADLHWYVRALEEVVVRALRRAGVDDAGREPDVTGVWCRGRNTNTADQREKVAAVGVKVRRWVASHGAAVNVEARSIPPFDGIVPCGLEGRGVTCLNDALERRGAPPTTVADFCRDHVLPAFEEVFGAELARPS